MDLSTRSLRYLLAVIDAGHFGHAARSLFISAPSLTQQIQKLESQVGFQLLERGHHPIRPTEEAEEFIDAARESVAALDRATAVASGIGRQRRNVIGVGFTAGTLVRSVIDGLVARAPELGVDLVELAWPDQVRAVLKGVVDASFVRSPVEKQDGLQFVPVAKEGRVLAVPAGHHFAARDTVHIDELTTETQLKLAEEVRDDAWSRWWAIDPRPDGSRPRYGARFHTVTEFLELVACGGSIGITTPSCARQYARADVAFIELCGVPCSDVLLCVRSAQRGPVSTLVDVAESIYSTRSPGDMALAIR